MVSKTKNKKIERAIHLDVYTNDLKELITQLNDDTLDAINDNGKKKKKHILSSEKVDKNEQDADKIFNQMGSAAVSSEKKEKLQI